MASATDFYTMTPGSAVAGALQDILTRRKGEAHQAMLDKMAQEEQSSVISARQEQQDMARKNYELQQQQEARQKLLNEAQMREMDQARHEREMAHLATGTRESAVDPELAAYVRKAGGFRMSPESPDNPEVTGDTVQGASMESEYAGTPKDQEATAARDRAASIISQIQNEQDPQKRQALSFQLIQEGVDPRQIPEMLAKQQLVTASGKVIPVQGGPMVPASEANHFLGYAPNYGGTQSNARSNYQITHPDGSQEVRSLTAAGVADEEKKGNRAVEAGPMSLNTTSATAADRKSLIDARTMLEAARGNVGTWSKIGSAITGKPAQPDPQKLSAAESYYRSALASYYSADAGSSPKIKDLATKIAMHPQLSQMSTQELVHGNGSDFHGVSQLEGLTDKDIADLDRLLNATRGNPEAIFAVQ